MKVLMISSDRLIAKHGSAVNLRMKEVSGLVEELHIVILSDKKHGLSEQKISDRVWVYPTNSTNKFLRPFDAVRIGKKISADLITTQDPFECGWVGLRLKNILVIPLEVQLHTDMFSTYFNGFLNMLRNLIARMVLPKADVVRVVTENLKSKILKTGLNKNVYVLPIYIDESRISGESRFDLHNKYGFENILLSVSRFSEEKNLKLAVEVLHQVLRVKPNTGLVLVGSGPEEGTLKKQVESLGISKNVIFVGWQEDLVSYYRTADIYLQTSNFEGYGLSVIEAGLSGLPVVSTPVGVVNDLENVFVSKDKKLMIEIVISLIDDKSKRKNSGIALKKELEVVIFNKEDYLLALREHWSKLC